MYTKIYLFLYFLYANRPLPTQKKKKKKKRGALKSDGYKKKKIQKKKKKNSKTHAQLFKTMSM